MIKNLTLIVFSFLVFQVAKAQKTADTSLYLMKNNGQLAVDKKDADYFMFIMPVDSDTNLYPIDEYYPNGKPKFIGYSSTITYLHLVFEGPCITYFPNGHKESIITYHKGYILGDASYYYPNGSLYSIEQYDEKGRNLLIECRDSTGKVLAENGNGIWLRFNRNITNEIECGSVKDSLEDGEWKETIVGNEMYSAVYNKGTLISSTDSQRIVGALTIDTQKIAGGPFFSAIQYPEFAYGGAAGFNSYLAKNMKFPAIDRENGTVGKLIITFIVEKDGSLSNLTILKSPSNTMSEAAQQVVLSSPPWIAGTQFGKPIRTQFTISFAFSLATTTN